MVQLFPVDYTLDDIAFHLLYRQHGGSGLSISLGDIAEMEISRIMWWREKLDERREAEAEAIDKARPR